MKKKTHYKKEREFWFYVIKTYSGKIVPSNEIKEAKWFTKDEIKSGKIKISSGPKILVPLLEKDGLL